MYISKMIIFLKYVFYISILLLIIVSIYPGSLIGYFLYKDFHKQPILIENFFGEKIIGRHAICVADPDQVVGKFNVSMEGKVYTVVNELKDQGNFQKNSSLLKSLITDKTHKIERKGIDAVIIDNFNNFVFLTNNHQVLNIEADDRRYLCFENL